MHRRWERAVVLGAIATVVTVAPGCGKQRTPADRHAADDPRDDEPIGDASAGPAGRIRTPSGLSMAILQPGQGTEHPTASDRVKVNYTGWTKSGSMFDSSLPRGAPGLFTLTQVIPGWAEALPLMVPGEKRRLWVPARLAYGENPPAGVPPSDLIYDVELVEIIRSPKVPEDVAAPPKTALVTATGLAYRVLRAGTGQVRPRPTDRVVVRYSGWTTDGLLFDSTQLRSGPATFALDSLVQGWTEAVTLMIVGERARFWIPANLAYGDHPVDSDQPAGMLVFDIELLEIE